MQHLLDTGIVRLSLSFFLSQFIRLRLSLKHLLGTGMVGFIRAKEAYSLRFVIDGTYHVPVFLETLMIMRQVFWTMTSFSSIDFVVLIRYWYAGTYTMFFSFVILPSSLRWSLQHVLDAGIVSLARLE